MRSSYALTALELEVCWELLELGDLPAVLDVPVTGRTEQERRRVVAEVLDGLRARRLADHRGMDRALADLLAMVARYDWGAEAWLALDRPVRAMAAHAGRGGAVAVVDFDRVELWECSEASLLDQLVRIAGITPGPGSAVSVRGEQLDAAVHAAGTSMWRLSEELTRLGTRYDDARTLAQMCAGHARLAQFGVLVCDPGGRRAPGNRVIGLHATPAGWYFQLRSREHGGEFVTVGPARHTLVVTQLRELLTETRQLVLS